MTVISKYCVLTTLFAYSRAAEVVAGNAEANQRNLNAAVHVVAVVAQKVKNKNAREQVKQGQSDEQ